MMKEADGRSSFMEDIRSKGALAEKLACADLIENGFNVERISRGGDFVISKQSPKNNSLNEVVEVKYNGSKLSPLQKKTKQKMRQAGIPYSVYRVSDVYLDNVEKKLCSKKNSENHLLGLINDTMQHGVKYKIAVPSICPHCGNIAQTLVKIVEIFGLRTMDDETIRDQSWCKTCRSGGSVN